MAMTNVHANYLLDLGRELRESAEEAKKSAGVAEEDDRLFAQGRAMAYYEVISLMHQQATSFGLPLTELGLQGVDPERDLL